MKILHRSVSVYLQTVGTVLGCVRWKRHCELSSPPSSYSKWTVLSPLKSPSISPTSCWFSELVFLNLIHFIILFIYICTCLTLLTDFNLLTENKTGLEEKKQIEVKVTDRNDDEDCEDGDLCTDNIYYFIIGKYVPSYMLYN
jgi:hypothetical protein